MESRGDVRLLRHGEWEARFPGLTAGLTAGAGDYGLAAGAQARSLVVRYERLAETLGMSAVAVGRQVHGTRVLTVDPRPDSGLQILGEADGLVGRAAGLLLVVTVADCVPVYLLDPGSRWLALLHAGWRGVAGGIFERGLAALRAVGGATPGSIFLHLGPAICGACYEVGREVLAALGRPGAERGQVDLRAEIFARARREGLPPTHWSRSEHCTRCGTGDLHSYRRSGESAGRMAAFLGWRSSQD